MIYQLIKSSHFSKEITRDVENHLESYVYVLVLKASLDPLWQLFIFPGSHKSAIGQYHKSVVSLFSHHTTKALSNLPHGIKLEEFVSVFKLLILDHELNSLKKNRIMRVLNRKAHHDNTPSVMFLKVNTFGYLSSGDGKIHCSPSNVTGLPVLPQSVFGLHNIFLLNEQVLVLHQFINDP